MLQDKVILLVDDDLVLNEMYQHRLKEEGATVVVAHDGQEGIQRAEESHPNLILLDLMMPGVNGFEVLQYIKSNPITKDIPVIVLTVLIEDDKYEKAKKLGADDYIIKADTMPGDVIEKIKKMLLAPAA